MDSLASYLLGTEAEFFRFERKNDFVALLELLESLLDRAIIEMRARSTRIDLNKRGRVSLTNFVGVVGHIKAGRDPDNINMEVGI